MKWSFIYRPESNRHNPACGSHDGFYNTDFPVGTTLAQALAAMHAAGVPRGSARGGLIEAQTDEGIWSMPGKPRRLDPAKAVFKTWEQLDAEALAEDEK